MSSEQHQYCAACGYTAVGWTTSACPECGGTEITVPKPGEALARVVLWLIVLSTGLAVTGFMWFQPFELRLINPIHFPYRVTDQALTPERGFVIQRDAQGRFPFYHRMIELDAYGRLLHDPDYLHEMRVALYDGVITPTTNVDDVIQVVQPLNTLNYDHATNTAHFTEDGQIMTGPLDEAFTRRWIDTAYPEIDARQADSFAKAIPLACRQAVSVDPGMKLKSRCKRSIHCLPGWCKALPDRIVRTALLRCVFLFGTPC